MRIVLDTNILMAALIRDGFVRRLLASKHVKFCTPRYAIDEIFPHRDDVLRKAAMSKKKFGSLLALMLESVEAIDVEDFLHCYPVARDLMKDVDIKDAPVLACALAIKADGIWTADRHFQQQKVMRVYSSYELARVVHDEEGRWRDYHFRADV